MGAFGIMLQSYFGGTKHDVSIWNRPRELTAEEQEHKKLVDSDEQFLKSVKDRWYNTNQRLSRVKADEELKEITRKDFHTKEVWEEFKYWKKPWKGR